MVLLIYKLLHVKSAYFESISMLHAVCLNFTWQLQTFGCLLKLDYLVNKICEYLHEYKHGNFTWQLQLGRAATLYHMVNINLVDLTKSWR